MGSVIDLLKAYCPNAKKKDGMPSGNYINILRCLETLIEFVQGPCKENQMSLVDGKFFEVAEGILGLSPKKQEIKLARRASMSSRLSSLGLMSESDRFNQPMEEWMIERLKYHVTL